MMSKTRKKFEFRTWVATRGLRTPAFSRSLFSTRFSVPGRGTTGIEKKKKNNNNNKEREKRENRIVKSYNEEILLLQCLGYLVST